MEELAIRSQGIHKRYGHIQALKGVSLQVASGQIFGLIGANGAGKSTFIKLLVGIARADDGELAVLGLHPQRQAGALRQQLGYMPQSPALYEDLSAADNVRFFARSHQIDNLRESVEEALDFVELSQRADDPVGNLSGGMKQRVSLACAVAHRPRLLLLDEPTAGVDLKLRSAFWRHFQELAAAGTTILVSTHQMDEAVHCDNLAIISEGRIVAQDTPLSLIQSGRATVRVQVRERVEEKVFSNYPSELPDFLQAYGLREDVQRLEVMSSSLEEIVLDLMEDLSENQELQ